MDDELLSAAKKHAVKTGRTLTALMEDALRAFLAIEGRPRKTSPASLPTFGEGGLHPGIDLDNTADLLDAMDDPDAVG
jgi:hypothetical protein